MSEQQTNSIFRPGTNCWRIEPAQRVAAAIDGQAYFRAVREAILAAERTVFILGWDIHSRLKLVRDDNNHKHPVELGSLLDYVAREHGIDVYVLNWDFAMIYLAERETLPLYELDWKTHEQVHFHMDDQHPVGASHHQKVIVVDDCIAFCGGLDLSKWRWDTPEHAINDARRIDPDGKPYPPFHDIQMLVDGKAAAALGELARDRWYNATGNKIPVTHGNKASRRSSARVSESPSDPWPGSLNPIIYDTRVAIARTRAQYRKLPEIREAEQLYIDIISRAEDSIYIENQYLTAHCIQVALVDSLQREHGPEIVIVMPEKTGGWLEQHTMDVLRSRKPITTTVCAFITRNWHRTPMFR
jgi:phosphatidylserine/phosphatidylglycerophosphate/cardiolipin synthase-like enzyme